MIDSLLYQKLASDSYGKSFPLKQPTVYRVLDAIYAWPLTPTDTY